MAIRTEWQIALDGRVMLNDPDLAVRAAVDGLGIAYTIEALADPFLRTGQLVRVLQDWSPFSEGLFLYYPGHRQVPVVLRPDRPVPRHPRTGAGQRPDRDTFRGRVNALSTAAAGRPRLPTPAGAGYS